MFVVGRTGRILQNTRINWNGITRTRVAAMLAISILLWSVVPYVFNEDTMITLQAYAAADTMKPGVTIEQPSSGSKITAGTITVKGKSSDNNGGSGVQIVELSVDAGPYKVAKPKVIGDWSTWSISFAISSAGSHEIKAKATDSAGNRDWDVTTVEVVLTSTASSIDNADPTVTITNPTNGGTVAASSSITVKGTASDSGGSGIQNVWVRLDSGKYYSVTPKTANDWSTWSIQLASTTPGTHSLTAKARDNNNNDEWRTVTINVQSDIPVQQDDIPNPIRTINVNSIVDMMNAIASAKPGDHIILKNGVYDITNWLSSRSAKNLLVRGVDGTSAAPILISSETIGGAEIRGGGGFRFYDVSHLVIKGFKFTHSQDNAASSDDAAVQCHMCDYVRFTRNQFELSTGTSIAADWLSITSDLSDHNRIDHNSFKNKKTKGVFVLVFGKYTSIDHNYFYNQYYSGGNGGECMRLGNSEQGLREYYSNVENNLFENCNGDMEAVTVKSSSNVFRANTFRDNEGSLTFRHGNNNVADGNFFLNGENGIRSYGHDHKIINNYFGGLTGSGSLTPLVIGSGTVEQDLSSSNSQHSRSKNVLVAFNTFYNNRDTYARIGEDFRSLPPQYITVAHNILVGSSGTLVQYDEGENITWIKNILYGSASKGNMPTTGYATVNPLLIAKTSGIYGLSSTSPAIDQASSASYTSVVTDVDGQPRSAMKDTGADEYSTGAAKNLPLTSSDVGPSSA